MVNSKSRFLIDKLRNNYKEILSLIAIEKEKIIGHILFSHVVIEKEDNNQRNGTYSMSVLPELQRQRIGSQNDLDKRVPVGLIQQ